MSLGIAFKGPEGIVLAADSRVTLTAELQDALQRTLLLPASYDNATKLLRIKGQDYVGAITYGAGALGTTAPRTAHSYLPEFENELATQNVGRLGVEDFAERLANFFERQWNAAGMPATADPMVFLVGGFDEGAAYGRVFEMFIPTAVQPTEKNPWDSFGVTWGGQLETTSRILNGYDPSLLEVIRNELNLDDQTLERVQNALRSQVATRIPYAFLPLQDCVDLAILMIETTAAIQRFSVNVRGVGGAIDVSTITRTEGFKAIQLKTVIGKRELHE